MSRISTMCLISSTKAIDVAIRIVDANTSCNFLKKLTIKIYVSLINDFQKQIDNWVIKRRLGFNYLTVFSTPIRFNLRVPSLPLGLNISPKNKILPQSVTISNL